MEIDSIYVVIANILMCAVRLFFCIKARRLIAIPWFLITYFAVFFIPVSIGGEFIHTQGFTLNAIKIDAESIERTCLYVLAFNTIFLISEYLLWSVFRPKVPVETWELPIKSGRLTRLTLGFVTLMAVGTVVYWATTRDQGYRDYVEFQGSNWGIIFLWASAPAITISALRRQFALAIALCVPFLYFAFHMKVRAFALYSLIPVAIIAFLQRPRPLRVRFSSKLKPILLSACLFVALILSSSLIIQTKGVGAQTGFSFPDAGMPRGTAILFESIDRYQANTGWDSLILYGRNYINPFLKAIERVEPKVTAEVVDPPVVMAQLYDGVPRRWDVYFHYPTLWYTDAYISFGQTGLLFAILWAFVFTVFELIMVRSPVLFSLIVPFFCWHAYMLIRGAIAGASNPFAYAAYIAFFLAVLLVGPRLRFVDRKKLLNSVSPESE